MLHHFHAEPLLNYGVVQTYLPDEILEVLKAEAKEIQDSFDTANPYNKKLAGNIEKEFTLEKSGSALKPFILDMATFYTENFKLFNTWKPVFQKPWINFMKKHEFNPIHFHVPLKGLSYVIWVQIPYDPAEEKALPHSVNANQPMSSNFQFVYNTVLGDIRTMSYAPDRNWSGFVLMFPARLNHLVYPFYTSDDYRISISGNIDFVD